MGFKYGGRKQVGILRKGQNPSLFWPCLLSRIVSGIIVWKIFMICRDQENSIPEYKDKAPLWELICKSFSDITFVKSFY